MSSNGITLQSDALNDLKVTSQPRGIRLSDEYLKGYYYDSTAGQDTMVYVIDTGVDEWIPVSNISHQHKLSQGRPPNSHTS